VDADAAAQDARHAGELYRLLEAEIVPAFYERDSLGVPGSWVRRIKASLRTVGPGFCAARMLDDYLTGPYAG
jgi:starch phosphorylase